MNRTFIRTSASFYLEHTVLTLLDLSIIVRGGFMKLVRDRSLCLLTSGITILVILASVTFAVGQTTRPGRVRTVNANQYPGRDIGTKINAADRDLGTASGDIVINGGGTISTQVVISPGHTLRLGPGTYVTRTAQIPILLKPGSSIVGSGWDSIIVESPSPGQFTVIKAYNSSVDNANADRDLVIRDIQIKGANPGFDSVQQAISLGNCTNCTVDHVWINGTRSIGIQLGASSTEGHFAENSKVVNSLFTRVASQNLALVNGRNITFEGNRFLASGQIGGPGNTNIDLEPNSNSDHLENVVIRNNLIDVRESEVAPTGNAIVVQSPTGTPHVGNILVENNNIIGGSNVGVVTNILANGIYVFGPTMRDVIVRNNTITRTGQAGIHLEGTQLTVMNNKLTDVGGGGTAGFIVHDLTNSRIVGNTLTYSGQGPLDGRMLITGNSRNNMIDRNSGFQITRN
jgi:hypothetical protein